MDGELWSTSKIKTEQIYKLKWRSYKAKPLKRVYIPKSDGKVRPLGIPTIKDRVEGALKLILEPIFEADFQPGSCGYRPKRTAAEAIARVEQAVLKGKYKSHRCRLECLL